MGPDRLHAALRDHATAVEHHDPIGQRLGLLQVMGSQQHAAALRDQFPDRLPQPLPRLDVETRGRLVEEQQLRPAADRHRELHAPLLPTRQFSVAALQQAVEPRHRHAIGDAAWIGVIAAREFEQLTDAQRVGNASRLKHHPDAPARSQLAGRLPEQCDLAAVGLCKPEQQRDCRGLAGAVGAQQRQQLAAMHLQVEPVERAHLAVSLVHALQAREHRTLVP